MSTRISRLAYQRTSKEVSMNGLEILILKSISLHMPQHCRRITGTNLKPKKRRILVQREYFSPIIGVFLTRSSSCSNIPENVGRSLG